MLPGQWVGGRDGTRPACGLGVVRRGRALGRDRGWEVLGGWAGRPRVRVSPLSCEHGALRAACSVVLVYGGTGGRGRAQRWTWHYAIQANTSWDGASVSPPVPILTPPHRVGVTDGGARRGSCRCSKVGGTHLCGRAGPGSQATGKWEPSADPAAVGTPAGRPQADRAVQSSLGVLPPAPHLPSPPGTPWGPAFSACRSCVCVLPRRTLFPVRWSQRWAL